MAFVGGVGARSGQWYSGGGAGEVTALFTQISLVTQVRSDNKTAELNLSQNLSHGAAQGDAAAGTQGSASRHCTAEGFDPEPAHQPGSHSRSALFQPSSPPSRSQGLSLSSAFTSTLCTRRLKALQVGLLAVPNSGPAESSSCSEPLLRQPVWF